MAEITIRFFNSFSKYANGRTQWLVTLADGSPWLCYAGVWLLTETRTHVRHLR